MKARPGERGLLAPIRVLGLLMVATVLHDAVAMTGVPPPLVRALTLDNGLRVLVTEDHRQGGTRSGDRDERKCPPCLNNPG